jgi:hypothetical protein
VLPSTLTRTSKGSAAKGKRFKHFLLGVKRN